MTTTKRDKLSKTNKKQSHQVTITMEPSLLILVKKRAARDKIFIKNLIHNAIRKYLEKHTYSLFTSKM